MDEPEPEAVAEIAALTGKLRLETGQFSAKPKRVLVRAEIDIPRSAATPGTTVSRKLGLL